MDEFNIIDSPEDGRYVIEIGSSEVGFAAYRLRRGKRYFMHHTEISEAWAGKGVGKALVRFALEDIGSKDGLVVPICPFVQSFLRSNPEFRDLVDHQTAKRLREVIEPGSSP